MAEALAFGFISRGQVKWDQLLQLIDMLPGDSRERWSQHHNGIVDGAAPKRFTVGAWNFGNMAGVITIPFSSRGSRVLELRWLAPGMRIFPSRRVRCHATLLLIFIGTPET